MNAKLIMLQGTASSVGKSLLTAALCRILRQDGLRVAPFKAQNMSNNSFVTLSGGEIGRAQAVQAQAAGAEPSVDMNPILLKPEANHRSQLVVLGRACETLAAREYYQRKPELREVVLGALDRLRRTADVVVIEGAGSPAEINLRSMDLVNMGLATAVGAPVILAGDIDRGGVFAHLVGTLELLEPDERTLVRATLINKFRGDLSLLTPGLEFLERRTGIPVLGVVPHLEDHGVPEEDSATLPDRPAPAPAGADGYLDIAVLHYPRIANFTDLAPLAQEPGVWLRYVTHPDHLGSPDAVILPGSKATIADLAFLRRSGLAAEVLRLAAGGCSVIGICGGFQMLGTAIRDPDHIESALDEAPGLDLLPVATEFRAPKITLQVAGRVCAPHGPLAEAAGETVSGYEIHSGRPVGASAVAPVFTLERRGGETGRWPDGAMSAGGTIWGSYVHGLFDEPGFRAAFLRGLARRKGLPDLPMGPALPLDAVYDRLAARVRAAIDMDKLHEIVGS